MHVFSQREEEMNSPEGHRPVWSSLTSFNCGERLCRSELNRPPCQKWDSVTRLDATTEASTKAEAAAKKQKKKKQTFERSESCGRRAAGRSERP